MNQEEWQEMAARINADIAGIARAQGVLEEVNDALRRRLNSPVEEDYIDRDSFGENPGEPRVFEVHGVELSVRKLHRRGINCTDIKGADLIYEVVGKKFALIQYKSPSRADRISLDQDQLDELVGACPNPCPPSRREYLRTCGSWYSIQALNRSYYMPGCEAKRVFGTAASRNIDKFSHGISKDSFHELFAKCWIGARIAPIDVGIYLATEVVEDRVIVHVQQHEFR